VILHPFDGVVADADKYIREGWSIYQQFNCAACGTKQTMETPNRLYTKGTCEECGHVTDIRRDGCNYMLVGK
jgi:hypothetical protein